MEEGREREKDKVWKRGGGGRKIRGGRGEGREKDKGGRGEGRGER